MILPRKSQVQKVIKWWQKFTIYLRKIWIRVAVRFGVPKSGLGRLHHEIMRCEYEDVHVLWKLLKENEKGLSGDLRSKKNRTCSKLVHWVGRRSPFMRF
ncbi:uncharacterized protein LOC111886984 isoform X1 [Lactuca sativa]|uniref:Uncharacterized protein n=1 Tax=Lactuca sativa TaxID=4236 RepID=A0A9R1VQD3_LACSA|nr:uncharacterized protein LOC111886984 isoform X1 [Lactuca sativa]KAJ0208977.1 hypothetical protein LSAT_V11C400207610 [Lactuca sativa]